jgi:hypothetical protein
MGQCQSVTLYVATNRSPVGLAVDSQNVYFGASAYTFQAPGAVLSCPLAGCGKSDPAVLAADQNAPLRLLVRGSTLFWTNSVHAGTIQSCAVSNCTGTTTVYADGENVPVGVAIDDENIYWTTHSNGTVRVCPLAGCPAGPSTLASAQAYPEDITTYASNVFWGNSDSGGPGGSVATCAASGCGGDPTVLVPNRPDGGGNIKTDGTNLYWTECTPGNVMQCSIADCSGTLTVVASLGSACPRGLALDSVNVYWTNLMAGTVMQCAIGGCGGNPLTIATAQSPDQIAVDDKALYWTENTASGSVKRLAKPQASRR